MKNIFVIVCAVFLLFGDTNVDAGLRCRQQRSCCQPCQQPTCCPKPARQRCCRQRPARRSCCQRPARQNCCQASTCSQPADTCCGSSATAATFVAAPNATFVAEPTPAATVVSAPAPAVVYEGGNDFVAAPVSDMGASDCGCGQQVGVIESGDMSYSVAPVSEGVMVDGGVSEGVIIDGGVMTEGVSEGVATEGVIESPASDVPAAPVDDSSSYLGAPALQPGEWVVEGSEKVVEAGETSEASEGVTATPVSSSEVVYEDATATSTEAAATDAVPSAPSEEAAEVEAE